MDNFVIDADAIKKIISNLLSLGIESRIERIQNKLT